jgi:hypothetical protein
MPTAICHPRAPRTPLPVRDRAGPLLRRIAAEIHRLRGFLRACSAKRSATLGAAATYRLKFNLLYFDCSFYGN